MNKIVTYLESKEVVFHGARLLIMLHVPHAGHLFKQFEHLDMTFFGFSFNRSYKTHDGLMEVEVRVQDRVEFGPGLQTAKQIVDECLNEWSADARAEIRAIITDAFNTDQEGRINRSAIFSLLRLDIDDPRWQEAMRAIRDAMRVAGSKNQIYFRRAAGIGQPLLAITIDLAAA